MSQKHGKFLIVANWKMNKTSQEAVAFAEFLHEKIGKKTEVNVVICAPFTALGALAPIFGDSNIGLGAQNFYPENAGAYTGEISAGMLRDLYVNYVIVGHSERRQIFKETNEFINKKVLAALEASLKPILCVGETLAERESGRAIDVIKYQLVECLRDVPAHLCEKLVIAYEPIWAIGTGKAATPEMAQVVHGAIREFLKEAFGRHADKISVLYGGSINPDNAQLILAQADIDGALIGSASLSEKPLLDIVKIAKKLNKQQIPTLEEV